MAKNKQTTQPKPVTAITVVAKPTVPVRRPAMNATKHGLDAKTLIVAGETKQAFTRHMNRTIEAFQPQGYFEQQLVEQIGMNLWQQKRVPRFRAASARDQHDTLKINKTLRWRKTNPDVIAQGASLPPSGSLRKADKTEAHNVRTLQKLLSMLDKSQRSRSARLEIEAVEEKSQNDSDGTTTRRTRSHRLTGRIRLSQKDR